LPREAEAILEYAERHGMLVALGASSDPYEDEDEDAADSDGDLNPDFFIRQVRFARNS
jgi:hypothetical protein